MTIRQTQIIEWSTTPDRLRYLADHLASKWVHVQGESSPITAFRDEKVHLLIKLDEGQWQAEQTEDDNA